MEIEFRVDVKSDEPDPDGNVVWEIDIRGDKRYVDGNVWEYPWDVLLRAVHAFDTVEEDIEEVTQVNIQKGPAYGYPDNSFTSFSDIFTRLGYTIAA